jgi:putative ABC transport system substrate-binding protein
LSVIGGDPIATGLIVSLARPGGNLTGVSFLTASLTPKRFELLFGLVPQATRVALLVNPKNPQTAGVVDDLRQAVQAKGLAFESVEAANPEQIDEAFARFKQIQASMLIVESDPFFNARGDQFVGLAASSSLPAIYERRTFVAAGGLISYGTSLADVYRGVAAYVGKILNDAKPAELPMLQPTKFDLAINLKTAKELGLTVPPSLLVGADEVIE